MYIYICVSIHCSLTSRYKYVWCAKLWHRRTGKLLQATEHKAAAQASLFWPAESDAGLAHDYLELLNLICDIRRPPPPVGVPSADDLLA